MTENKIEKYYNEYIEKQEKSGGLISVSGFKKHIISQKKDDIKILYDSPIWPGVRGRLNIYYEDYLLERAAEGGRNSQTYTSLLNKFYDIQARRGADMPVVRVELDFANEGKNKI